MTTSTLSLIPDRRRRNAGFTLVEIMIGSTISAFILAGILSTFLFMGRSGANIQNYTDMESQARKALEIFAEDSRQAAAITWVSGNQIRLTVNTVDYHTYTYANGATANTGTLTRVVSKVSGGAVVSTMTLLTGIVNPVARTATNAATCTPFFRGYNLNGVEFTAIQYASPTATELASASSGTKQIQISMEASRTSRTVMSATNTVLSARFILRNKVVTA
jgi:prepilin-type N-terminal cleavage/methylation domain-containing protein